jgi:hypothetical protein
MFKPQELRRIGEFPKVCLALLFLAPAGCNNTGPEVGQVSGMVRYKNEALPSGTITWTVLFVSQDGEETTGLVGKGGEYTVDRVPTGTAKIGVVGMPRVPPGLVGPRERPPALDEADRRRLSSLKKFSDPNKSGLTYTVNKGKQSKDIELD